jgi:hypothetical protein
VAALPMMPGFYAIYRLIRADRHTQGVHQKETQRTSSAKRVHASTRREVGSGRGTPEVEKKLWNI